jgi:Cytochrome P450
MIIQQLAYLENNQIPPPGPPALSFAGMLPFWGTHLHLKLNRLAEKYGSVLQIETGGRKVVVLSGIETIKEALVKQQDNFNIRADLEIFKQPPQSHFLELKSGKT